MSVAPPPVPRKPLHLRRISCEGFQRDDGLIDLEGLLIDTKPVPLPEPWRSALRAVVESAPG